LAVNFSIWPIPIDGIIKIKQKAVFRIFSVNELFGFLR